MSHQIHAAMSVINNTAHFIILRKSDTKFDALYMDEYQKVEDDNAPLWFLKFFNLRSESFPGKPKNISIALDKKLLFIHTFPVDTGLRKDKENEFMNWELSQHIQNYHAKEYLSDTHTLKTFPEKQKKEILSVTIKRSYVYDIHDCMTKKNFILDYIDAIHFATGDLINFNHPEIKNQAILLIYIDNDHLECSRYSNGNLIDYKNNYEMELGLISKFIKSQFNREKTEKIFIYGPNICTELLVKLRTDITPHITILNPFLRIGVEQVKNFNRFTPNIQNFIPAIGIALRNL